MSTVPSFAQINIGSYANDSTGDSLRVAFSKVNTNFSNVWSIVSGNGSGNVSGNVSVIAIPNTIVLRDGNGSGFFNAITANSANLESVTIASQYSLPPTSGNVGQALIAGANGSTQWANITATAPGSNSQVIFNQNGQLQAGSGFTTDGNNVTVSGNLITNISITTTNLTVTNLTNLISNTISTSSGSGALVVSGGVGVAGNINAQGNIYVNGVPVLTSLNFPQTNIYNLNYNNLGTSQTTIDTVNATTLSSIGYFITAIDNVNGYRSSAYINMLYDGANLYTSQYGVLNSNDLHPAATFDGNISAGVISLLAAGNSSNVSIVAQRTTLGSTTPTGNVTLVNASGRVLVNNTPLAVGNRYLGSTTNFANITIYSIWPGNMINYQASTWSISIAATAGTGISIRSAVVVTTAVGNNIPITTTPVTFNGYPFITRAFLTSPTVNSPQFIQSDPINVPLNPNFDNWLLFYFDNDGTGYNANLGMYRTLMAGSLIGSQASGNLLALATMPTITAYNSTGFWSCNSVN